MCNTFQNNIHMKHFKIHLNQTIKNFSSHVASLERTQLWILRLCHLNFDFEVKMRTTIITKISFSQKFRPNIRSFLLVLLIQTKKWWKKVWEWIQYLVIWKYEDVMSKIRTLTKCFIRLKHRPDIQAFKTPMLIELKKQVDIVFVYY